MKIASIVLFVLALASLALTANALKSTKAQLARVQAQLADEVAHSSALQHALQAEKVANDEYLEKTKKAAESMGLTAAHNRLLYRRISHDRKEHYT